MLVCRWKIWLIVSTPMWPNLQEPTRSRPHSAGQVRWLASHFEPRGTVLNNVKLFTKCQPRPAPRLTSVSRVRQDIGMLRHLRLPRISPLASIALFLAVAGPGDAQEPIRYHLSFPSPAHHWAQVEVTFTGLPAAPLEARMSRAS